MYYVGLIFEGLVKYVFLSVIIVMGVLLGLMLLLYERERVREFLRVPLLEDQFERLCQLSDRLDEPYRDKNPYGSAMWVVSLIWKGVIGAAGLMLLWMVVSMLRG